MGIKLFALVVLTIIFSGAASLSFFGFILNAAGILGGDLAVYGQVCVYSVIAMVVVAAVSFFTSEREDKNEAISTH